MTNDEIKSLIHRQVASANLSSSDENVERYGKVGAVAADMAKDAGHRPVAVQAAGKAAAAAISRGATHSSAASAAEAVTKTPSRDVKTTATDGKRVWKASQIAKMKPWEFEKAEADIDAARVEGRIDYNS